MTQRQIKQRAGLLLAAIVAVLALGAPTALGNTHQQTIFDATGDLLRAPTVAARDEVLDNLADLGVDTVRIILPWRGVAPSPNASSPPPGFDAADPAAYSGAVMSTIDESIRGAEQRGMRVLLTPSSPIPDWASASGTSSLAYPVAADFRQLLIALGKRYDGTFTPAGDLTPLPRVNFWSIWNEGNLRAFLLPQKVHGKHVSGAIYRKLFLAGQQGLKSSGHGGDPLLIGETSPTNGRTSTGPINFLQQALCLNGHYHHNRSCAPIDADGWAQHPYDQKGTPIRASSPGVLGIPELGTLADALQRAKAAGATVRRLPIYVTEYGVDRKPSPDGAPPLRQAEYLAIAEFQLWRNPQVRSFGQYLLDDDPANNGTVFRTGLRTSAGVAQPAYAGFPIPLVVRDTGKGPLKFWGHVRPVSASVAVDVEARTKGGQITTLRHLKTNPDGYFQFSAPRGSAAVWRATSTLPDSRVLMGPFVRAYRLR